jgi:hypothetical protein
MRLKCVLLLTGTAPVKLLIGDCQNTIKKVVKLLIKFVPSGPGAWNLPGPQLGELLKAQATSC